MSACVCAFVCLCACFSETERDTHEFKAPPTHVYPHTHTYTDTYTDCVCVCICMWQRCGCVLSGDCVFAGGRVRGHAANYVSNKHTLTPLFPDKHPMLLSPTHPVYADITARSSLSVAYTHMHTQYIRTHTHTHTHKHTHLRPPCALCTHAPVPSQ